METSQSPESSSASGDTELEIAHKEIAQMILEFRQYANNLRSLSEYMDLDPDVVADQIEEIING